MVRCNTCLETAERAGEAEIHLSRAAYLDRPLWLTPPALLRKSSARGFRDPPEAREAVRARSGTQKYICAIDRMRPLIPRAVAADRWREHPAAAPPRAMCPRAEEPQPDQHGDRQGGRDRVSVPAARCRRTPRCCSRLLSPAGIRIADGTEP